MDLNDLRAAVTVASFAAFVAVVWWAYAARRKGAFDRAARSILDEAEENGKARGDGQ
jgi:cytochrome c oxidase cbb3-type subunit 4